MTDFISQKKALDELSSLYQKEVSEKATPESGTGKYYNEKKPTSQQLEKREKMNKVKALTNAGKHQEASKLYKSTMKKEEVVNEIIDPKGARRQDAAKPKKETPLTPEQKAKRDKANKQFDKDHYRPNPKEYPTMWKKREESFKSNWRDDLREIVGTGGLGGDVEDTQSAKPNSEVIVKEKNVKNKVVIDPEVKLEQSLGGKVVELKTVSEKMTTAALEDSPSDCPDCGEPVHEGACATAEEEKTVEESILWDRIARDLTRLGEMYSCKFKVEGYQRNPEKGEEEERKAEKRRKESGRMPPRGDKRREDFERWYAANVR
jgi:hypothetical protein